MTDSRLNRDSALLKILAVAFMFIDHIGATIYPSILELRVLGRIAFPLFAWGVVLGADYTHNIWIYLLRVLGLGLVVQPLYNHVMHHDWSYLNIMFTISLALFGIAGMKWKKFGSQILFPFLAILASKFFYVDYGFKGILFIMLLYLARQNKYGFLAFYLAFTLYWGSESSTVTALFGIKFNTGNPFISVFAPYLSLQSLSVLALPFILIPTQSKLRIPKWLSYTLYPLHLVLLLGLQTWLK